MAILSPEIRTGIIRREWLRQQFDRLHEQQNYTRNTNATAMSARELIAADLEKLGISPEERIFSRGIVEMREE